MGCVLRLFQSRKRSLMLTILVSCDSLITVLWSDQETIKENAQKLYIV